MGLPSMTPAQGFPFPSPLAPRQPYTPTTLWSTHWLVMTHYQVAPSWHISNKREGAEVYEEFACMIPQTINGVARKTWLFSIIDEETEAQVGLVTKGRSMWHGA